MVLLFGSREDPHVTSVAEVLDRSGCVFLIFDCYDRESAGLSAAVGKLGNLKLGGRNLAIEEIDAVWWRQKPRFRMPSESVSDLYNYYYISREWVHIQEYLGIALQDVYCINPRQKASRANNKIFQLGRAESQGFRTPKTLITNNPDSAREFVRSLEGGPAIYKTLTPYANPTGKVTYTTVVEDSTIDRFKAGLEVCPGIFQEFIPKQFELRITVVESEVFAAHIDSHSSPEVSIDWRKSIFDDMYEEYTLSSEFHSQILRLHHDFGLIYGAYDFIVDPEGVPVFLEVNPAGQWLWLEQRLGFPISERIAGALKRKGEPEG